MERLDINTQNKYPVFISDGIDEFGGCRGGVFASSRKILIITDGNVDKLYGDVLDKFFTDKEIFRFVTDAGERCKSADTYIKILSFLSENDFCREDFIIALGGGAVGDLSGFVASTYMRGIGYAFFPTTILSAVDSCIGGKTAIDLDGYKNTVGSFYDPRFVYINLSFFETLPRREVKSGFGEIIKYSFLEPSLNDADLSAPINAQLISKCLKIKKRYIEKDPFDRGDRRLLNLGHTFGHAIESLSGYELSHGECVVKGINISLRVSKALFGTKDDLLKSAYHRLTTRGIDPECGYDLSELKKALLLDKKFNGEKMNLVAFDADLKPVVIQIDLNTLCETSKV